MKIRTITLFLLLFASCDNPVRFEVPQPEGKEDESSLPKKIMGTYKGVDGYTILTITTNDIIKTVQGDYLGLVTELDSADLAIIKRDTAFHEANASMKYKMTIKGDSVFEHIDSKDTLFSFSKKDVLRKFKGYYFLNNETGPNQWTVTKLGLTSNGILLGTVSNKEDLQNLRELTNVKSDTVYNFRPTKKQLKLFIRDKGFQNEERFVKIEGGR